MYLKQELNRDPFFFNTRELGFLVKTKKQVRRKEQDGRCACGLVAPVGDSVSSVAEHRACWSFFWSCCGIGWAAALEILCGRLVRAACSSSAWERRVCTDCVVQAVAVANTRASGPILAGLVSEGRVLSCSGRTRGLQEETSSICSVEKEATVQTPCSIFCYMME